MKLWMNYAALAAVATSMTLASCGDDDSTDVPLVNQDPTIQLLNASSTELADFDSLELNETVSFTVVAEDVDENLQSLAIARDGTVLGPGEQKVQISTTIGGDPAPLVGNAILIPPTGDSARFERTVEISAPATAETSVEYTFTVTDSDGATASSSVTLETGAAQTQFGQNDSTAQAILFNASGPNFGAFDLDNNEAVSSNDTVTRSELQDLGISDPTTTNGAWFKQIQGENGTMLRSLSTEDASVFNYGSIEFQEEVNGFYDRGQPLAMNITEPLASGDVFIARRDDITWIIEIAAVNESPDDNLDSYEFRYKRSNSL